MNAAAGGGKGDGADGPKLNAAAGGGKGDGADGPKLNAAVTGGGKGEGADGPKAKADVNGITKTAATVEIERTDNFDIRASPGKENRAGVRLS